MSDLLPYSFTRYLAAKKSVDDRALNRSVWETLCQNLPPAAPESPLRVLEIGAGIGTMLERMLSWGLLTWADYTAIDAQEENIRHACSRLPEWARQHGFRVEALSPGQFLLESGGRRVFASFLAQELSEFAALEGRRRDWDLLVAHAFLDLIDIPAALPVLFNLLRESGLYYFSLNFDGATLFEPAIDPVLDEHIQALYHQTMDERRVAGRPSGDSRSGRHLFTHLARAGARILEAGSSDWVVFPGPQGYPQDEAYFLHFILHTLYTALKGHPLIDAERFENWIARRHAQIENCELVYIAHQLDFMGRI